MQNSREKPGAELKEEKHLKTPKVGFTAER